jgi:hypothetical protein
MSDIKNYQEAHYIDPGIEKYRNNPLICALPPVLDTIGVKNSLIGRLNLDPVDIYKDGRVRAHLITQLLDDFFQPLTSHLQLELTLSMMIRQGYVGRNPTDGSLSSHLKNGYERVQKGEISTFCYNNTGSTAKSSTLIGCSGCGKSSTINRIMSTYPQVIYHEDINFTQVVYLKIDCPHDGSLKSLCNYSFSAIDRALNTNYEQKYAQKRHGIETLIMLMAQVANIHAVGVLVIDEIQHLSLSRSGGVEKMLNFFVTFVNTIGLPVMLVGTPKARQIFERDLRSARRCLGFGALLWEPMKHEVSFVSPNSNKTHKSEWVAFTDKLWQYQWLQKKAKLSDEVRSCWFNLTQGVIDIVIKLFVLAQIRAIFTGIERITIAVLTQVYDDELRPVHPMLEALRTGDPERINEY